ncbi:large subunit ribosomal protein L7A [Dethiosulfatibacter aminovorans DSM 17477]|uniref:Large subunit ribosomal protein L7A n=1 Tax=Dethiosulfatibacter aminovorans DSM 17477 TaxID=1121476 RepID=A0A1M6MMJ3_9FIRM|nr:ribosomal L7Ae/L30e/S12e/Gadd45 family protein [Dethiosulfatibacter aminovorans]SHJ84687.1 large subunit ribosomal protein L7A [Dethiosulfatibacter aminovorans DSM 17477]
MELEKYKKLNRLIIGKKQTERSLQKNEVECIYIAKDADEDVVVDIIRVGNEKNIEIIYVENMKKLGEICNIDVNAAVAAVIK